MSKPNPNRILDLDAVLDDFTKFLKGDADKLTFPQTKLVKEVSTFMELAVEPQLAQGYSLYLNDAASAKLCGLTTARVKAVKRKLSSAGILWVARYQRVTPIHGQSAVWLLKSDYILEKAGKAKPVEQPKKRRKADQSKYLPEFFLVTSWAHHLAMAHFGDTSVSKEVFFGTRQNYMTELLESVGLTRADFKDRDDHKKVAAVKELMPIIQTAYHDKFIELEEIDELFNEVTEFEPEQPFDDSILDIDPVTGLPWEEFIF